MQTHATALFADRHAAHAAIEQLVQAGFPRDEISIVMSEDTHEREFGSLYAERSGVRPRPNGVLGSIVTGLVALASPGGLAVRAAGPLALALLRAASAVCSFSTSLATAGFSEHQALFVDHGVRTGLIVVGVHTSLDRARLALQLLELSGGSALQAA
jgi:hypothetical protein